MNDKHTLGLAVFVSQQVDAGTECVEDERVLTVLQLEDFMGMVYNYKQVRVLITFVLLNMPC